MTTMEERVGRLEGAFQQFDQRLERIEVRLDRIEARMDQLEARLDGMFRTMMIIMATGAIAIAGAIFILALRV